MTNSPDNPSFKTRRAYIARVKTQLGCKDCGYNEHPAALDFDHIDPGEKKFNIGEANWKMTPWGQVLDEMAKCVVRCANCHRIRSAGQRTAMWQDRGGAGRAHATAKTLTQLATEEYLSER